MSDPAPESVLARLEDELAEVARETARLLVQPEHDPADMLALDIRAAALRRLIAAARPSAPEPEPVELWRGYGGLVSGG